MFGIIPKVLWAKRMPPDERNRIPLSMRCLLLESSDRLILIDNGLGTKITDKFANLYAVDQETSSLSGSLRSLGFAQEDVTDVILTHLHFDHCGGSTERQDGRLQVAFPNATFHVQRTHWDWARRSNPKEHASFLDENLEPLAASGQLNLLDGAGALLPGIDLMLVNGHTEAQQIVKVSGPEGVLVYVADLLPTTAHLAPAWTMGYDVRPLVTMEEKARLLRQAEQENWSLFFEHDPEVAVASVRLGEKGIETVGERPLGELF